MPKIHCATVVIALACAALAACGGSSGGVTAAADETFGQSVEPDSADGANDEAVPDNEGDGADDTVLPAEDDGVVVLDPETGDGDGGDHDDESHPFSAMSTRPTCDADAHTGRYCGGDKVSHGDRNTLYACRGPGMATVENACAGECHVAPAGEDDFCRATAPTCDGDAGSGEYCGGDKVSHGRSNTLYSCRGPGRATVVRACANGCHVAAAGSDDFCRAAAPTCDSDARTGAYCGGDKVSHGRADRLYRCSGPGPARLVEDCSGTCTVAAAGRDDFCSASSGGDGDDGAVSDCPHMASLAWGLAPKASDHLRCAGIGSGSIMQTIGSAAASAGTHARDGTIGGHPYSAAVDLRTSGLSDSQVRALLGRLSNNGFAAFFRNPGHDGWPSSELRHIHAIYVGVPMKSSLRSQVSSWLSGRNGLVSNSSYGFYQASSSQKTAIRNLFNAHN